MIALSVEDTLLCPCTKVLILANLITLFMLNFELLLNTLLYFLRKKEIEV